MVKVYAPRVVEVPLGGLIADLVAAGWGKS